MQTRYGACLLCLVLATVGFVRAAQTPKQAPPRLVTRWAKEVRPDNVWPEYPRPQMVRPAWQNLNGLWQYAITARDATPAADAYRGTILVPFAVESFLSGARAAGHAGSTPLVSPHVHGARRGPPADASLLHFGAVDWEALVSVNGTAGWRASRRLRSVHRSTSPMRFARAAIRRSSSASGIRPTRVRSRAANRCSTREASGTPPSPASGRPCGSRPCHRRTRQPAARSRMSMRARCGSPWTRSATGPPARPPASTALDGARVVGSGDGPGGRDDRGHRAEPQALVAGGPVSLRPVDPLSHRRRT